MCCCLIVSCVVSSAVYRQRHLWCIWTTNPRTSYRQLLLLHQSRRGILTAFSVNQQRKFPNWKLSIPNCLAHQLYLFTTQGRSQAQLHLISVSYDDDWSRILQSQIGAHNNHKLTGQNITSIWEGKLGRTKMGAWQDKNESLAGQKWEAWQKITCNTSHAATFSLIFVSVLPFLVGFFHIFLFFFQFCMFFSHLSAIFAHWQNSLAALSRSLAGQN